MKVWAAYTSTPKYSVSGTTLHASRREALFAVIAYIRAGREDDDGYDFDPEIGLPDDELVEWIEEHADQEGTDWDVSEVDTPETPPRDELADRREQIRLAICDLRDAQERLRLAGCPYARLAVARARKSVEGAQRHAQRGMGPSTRKVKRQRRRDVA